MKSLIFSAPCPKCDPIAATFPFVVIRRSSKLQMSLNPVAAANPIHPLKTRYAPPSTVSRCHLKDDEDAQVQDLKVPQQWLHPSKALEESEWLRVSLHKWLDDEYYPEDTNVEISRVAARSYYQSLLDERTELGDILLKMALELEAISYQDSFHGAFSSANAAVNLISQRIQHHGNVDLSNYSCPSGAMFLPIFTRLEFF